MKPNERKVFYAFVRFDLEQRAKEAEQQGGGVNKWLQLLMQSCV